MDDKALAITLDFLKDQMIGFNQKIDRLHDKQEVMNNVLTENTVIVKEHERRSIAIEGWADNMETRFVDMVKNINKVEIQIDNLDKKLEPVEIHVEKVSKVMSFISGVPTVLKVTALIITIFSAFYGVAIIIHDLMPRK